MKRVSIILASYNRSEKLSITLRNIFEQKNVDFELIVINDASTDDTDEIVRSFQLGTDNLVYIVNAQNLGLQKSLNVGLHHAKGKYIARIDDHDLWIDPLKLQTQVEFLDKNPEVGLVGTAFKANGDTYINPIKDKEIRKQMPFRCPFCHVSVMFRKELLATVGFYDESLTYSEDWDFWFRMGSHTKMHNLQKVMVELSSENGLSEQFHSKQHMINFSLYQKYKHHYPKQIRALMYHLFVITYFRIIPSDVGIHRFVQKVFYKTFFGESYIG